MATRGKWHDYSAFPELRSNSHSWEFSASVHQKDATNKFRGRFPKTTKVFISYSVKIPEGKAMLDATVPGEFPESSAWKMAWIRHEEWSDDVDFCLPSKTPTLSIGGNSLDPDVSIQDGKKPAWWLFDEWKRFGSGWNVGPARRTTPAGCASRWLPRATRRRVLVDKEAPIMAGGEPLHVEAAEHPRLGPEQERLGRERRDH